MEISLDITRVWGAIRAEPQNDYPDTKRQQELGP